MRFRGIECHFTMTVKSCTGTVSPYRKYVAVHIGFIGAVAATALLVAAPVQPVSKTTLLQPIHVPIRLVMHLVVMMRLGRP